jgi:hypothetical protein
MSGRYGAVLLLLVAGVAIGGDAPRGGIPRAANFQEGVDAAIERGVAWLRTRQRADGSYEDEEGYPGAITALAYHTLRVCGVARDDPASVRTWNAGRKLYARQSLRTYSAAIYLMAIASHGEAVATATDDRDVRLSPEDAKWAREIAGCLAGAQNDRGGWSYHVAPDADPAGGGGSGAGAKRFGNFLPHYDHSNTQYALLGLKHAARCGVPIDDGVWKRSLEHFLAAQEKTGPEVRRRPLGRTPVPKGATNDAPSVDQARGWGYLTGDVAGRNRRGAYASMTAAGVSSLVICRSELLGSHLMTARLEAESERAVWDGLAWLGSRWPVTSSGELPSGLIEQFAPQFINHYEYYGVERAGVLAGVDWMAGLDWYGVGAEALVEAQTRDGAWRPREGPDLGPALKPLDGPHTVVDTCFALLFLRRGTTPVRRGAVTQGGADDDINFAVASKLGDKDFADLLDLVLARWRRATDDAVKTRLFDGATSAGPRIVEPLLVRMDAADAAERTAAHALLRHATGLDFGFAADAKPELRDAALVKWQSWWMTSKSRLQYDASSRRLVVR